MYYKFLSLETLRIIYTFKLVKWQTEWWITQIASTCMRELQHCYLLLCEESDKIIRQKADALWAINRSNKRFVTLIILRPSFFMMSSSTIPCRHMLISIACIRCPQNHKATTIMNFVLTSHQFWTKNNWRIRCIMHIVFFCLWPWPFDSKPRMWSNAQLDSHSCGAVSTAATAAMFLLDRLTWKTSILEHRVSSCNSESYIDLNIYLPHSMLRGHNRYQLWVVGHPSSTYEHRSLATHWPCCVRFPDFLTLWNGGAQSVDFGSTDWRKWGLVS